MKNLSLSLTVLFFVQTVYADGQWQHTAAYRKCHEALNIARELCPTDYHKPNSFLKMFKSSNTYDSFEHITGTCAEKGTDGRKINVKKYMIKYDSIKNICYYGYSFRESYGIPERYFLSVFNNDQESALARLGLNSENELAEFIRTTPLSLDQIVKRAELQNQEGRTHQRDKEANGTY